MRNAILLSAAVLLAACATGGEAKRGELVSAQQKAQASSQTAADAQKRAMDEQTKAEQAQRDLTTAEKNVENARIRLRDQRAKAQQAQIDARRLSEQANQEGLRAQEQSAINQQALAQQERALSEQRGTMEQTVQGQVVDVQGNELQIWTPQNQDMKLDLSASMVRVDGQQSSAAQIKPGSDVRASYKMVDGKAKVLQIDVTSR